MSAKITPIIANAVSEFAKGIRWADGYDDLVKSDLVNLDIFWLKEDALEDSANIPAPDIIAAEMTENLQAALEQFSEIAGDLITAESHTDKTQGG